MKIQFTLDTMDSAVKKFLSMNHRSNLFAFYGSMGAGKTTFITHLCKMLGVESDVINSPTFSIVNEYLSKDTGLIYHFDFYRINNPQEALDFGLYDYFDSGNLCLMEWPEQIDMLLPDDVVKVFLSVNDDESRILEFDL